MYFIVVPSGNYFSKENIINIKTTNYALRQKFGDQMASKKIWFQWFKEYSAPRAYQEMSQG